MGRGTEPEWEFLQSAWGGGWSRGRGETALLFAAYAVEVSDPWISSHQQPISQAAGTREPEYHKAGIEREVVRCETKLGDESRVARVPAAVVEQEKAWIVEWQGKLVQLRDILAGLG